MRLVSWSSDGLRGIAVRRGTDLVHLDGMDMLSLVRAGGRGLEDAAKLAETGRVLDPSGIQFIPVIPNPTKIICVVMNYQDHADENRLKKQEFPTFFARFNSTLIGHGEPILRPFLSDTLDYEGEMAVIIGKPG